METCCPSMEEKSPMSHLEISALIPKITPFFKWSKPMPEKAFCWYQCVFFAVKRPLKHNHQAASSHCLLWFKSYCSSRERSKCRWDTLKSLMAVREALDSMGNAFCLYPVLQQVVLSQINISTTELGWLFLATACLLCWSFWNGGDWSDSPVSLAEWKLT